MEYVCSVAVLLISCDHCLSCETQALQNNDCVVCVLNVNNFIGLSTKKEA